MAEASQGDVSKSFLLFLLCTLCASVSMEKCICCGFRILEYFLLNSWVSPKTMFSLSTSSEPLNVTVESWISEQVLEPPLSSIHVWTPPRCDPGALHSNSGSSCLCRRLQSLLELLVLFMMLFYVSCWLLCIAMPTNCLKMAITGEWGWGGRQEKTIYKRRG